MHTLSDGKYAVFSPLCTTLHGVGSPQGSKIKRGSVLSHFCPASMRESLLNQAGKGPASSLTELSGVICLSQFIPRGVSYADWLKLDLQDQSMAKSVENLLIGLDSSGPTPGAGEDISGS